MGHAVLSPYLAVRVEAVYAEGYEVTVPKSADPPRCLIRHPSGLIVDAAGSSVDDAVLRALTQLRRHLAERSP
jgi:hypothetical protein